MYMYVPPHVLFRGITKSEVLVQEGRPLDFRPGGFNRVTGDHVFSSLLVFRPRNTASAEMQLNICMSNVAIGCCDLGATS